MRLAKEGPFGLLSSVNLAFVSLVWLQSNKEPIR